MRKKLHSTPLRNLRKARTLSQAELAALADVSQQTLSKFERGLLVPTPDVQARLATILGVNRYEAFPLVVEPEAVSL